MLALSNKVNVKLLGVSAGIVGGFLAEHGEDFTPEELVTLTATEGNDMANDVIEHYAEQGNSKLLSVTRKNILSVFAPTVETEGTVEVESGHGHGLWLMAINIFIHTSSPAVPRASPAPTRPRGEEPCPRGVSAGMLATCSLPLDSRSALDTPVQHPTDAGSHRARLCECSGSARGPHRASRSAGGAARQPPAPVVAWKLELSLCRGSYT